MKRIFSVVLVIFTLSIMLTLLFGCRTWNQGEVEQQYGPPAKKEIVDDKIIYYYYWSGRSWKIPYNMETWCYDFTFDKNGKLINKRAYLVQPSQLPDKSSSSSAMGTGWPVRFGYVVTNHHIVEGREKITLIRPDGKKISATVFVGDKVNDIVLLKVSNPSELAPALPITVSKPGIGTKVFTMGYPHPDILGINPKLTDGIISAVSGFQDDPRTYQITVPLQAGNSGGPLLNLNGEVIGIVTSQIDAVRVFRWTGDLPQNVNYAVKISYLKALIDSVTAQNYSIKELTKEPGDLEKLSKRIRDSIMIVLAE